MQLLNRPTTSFSGLLRDKYYGIEQVYESPKLYKGRCLPCSINKRVIDDGSRAEDRELKRFHPTCLKTRPHNNSFHSLSTS